MDHSWIVVTCLATDKMDIIRQLDACYLFFIVERIFTYLDLLSRMQLGCVCKTWRRIFHSVKLQRIMKVRQQNEPALFSNFAVLKRILPSHESFRLDDEHVRCCAMNGQWMAAGCQSGRIPVWSRQTLRRWLVLSVDNDKPVTSLYADDRVLIAGFQGGLVAIWNVKTFHLLQLITVRHVIACNLSKCNRCFRDGSYSSMTNLGVVDYKTFDI